MNRPATTIKQIADASGVHPSTVSRPLDPKKRHSSPATWPSGSCRKRRRSATNPTAWPRIYGWAAPISSAFSCPISPIRCSRRSWAGIAETLSTEGYAPIVTEAGNAPSQQISFAETLLSQRVDRLILATVSQDDELVGFCIQHGLPVFLVNRSEARDRVSSVVSDDDRRMRLAVNHLVDLGHRHIARIAGPLSMSTGVLRRDGFERAMSHYRLRGMVREAAGYTREAGAQATALLLDAKNEVLLYQCEDAIGGQRDVREHSRIV